MEKFKAGQWWETVQGERIYVMGITSEIPGAHTRAMPVVCVSKTGRVSFHNLDGKCFGHCQDSLDLGFQLPAECNGFDWFEEKWRDAEPSDVSYPFKDARFRDSNSDFWAAGTLNGRVDSPNFPWVSASGTPWRQCQVKESK